MPNKDGTGPNGNGPKTGRGRGACGDGNNDTNNEARPRRGNGGCRKPRRCCAN